VILATGLRRRRHPAHTDSNISNVIYTAGPYRDLFKGKRITVIGGGDGAVENAATTAETAAGVTLISRSGLSARTNLIKGLKESENLSILNHTDIIKIKNYTDSLKNKYLESKEMGSSQVYKAAEKNTDFKSSLDYDFIPNLNESRVLLTLKSGDSVIEMETDYLLVKIGFEPQSDIRFIAAGGISSELPVDSRGYFLPGNFQSLMPGIWTVGDVCNPFDPSLSVCAGNACVAVRDVARLIFKEKHLP
jgi:thioredoxin reductase